MTLITLAPPALRAEDNIEKAGVAVGVSAGNMWFLPIKAIVMSVGAISGALSYVVTGGNAELTQQIWRDTMQEPYIITPELRPHRCRPAAGARSEEITPLRATSGSLTKYCRPPRATDTLQ